MTDKTIQPEVWLDHRVARTMPTEPDDAGNLVRYFSADRVKEMIDLARGGPEFIIQITEDHGRIHGLTNYGRIFYRVGTGKWAEADTPDFSDGGPNDAQMES